MKKKRLLSLPVTALLLLSTVFPGAVQATPQTTAKGSSVISGSQVNANNTLRKSQMKAVKNASNKVSITKETESKLETAIKEKLNKIDPQNTSTYQTGEVILKYKKKVTTGEISTLQKKFSLKSTKKLKSVNAEVVKIPTGQSTTDYINELEQDPTIESVQPNYKYYPSDVNNAPNYYDQLWGLNNTKQAIKGNEGFEDIDVDAPEGWAKFGSKLPEVVVGVIDTGVDITHPDLEDKIWTNPIDNTFNGIDEDKNGYTDDVHGWDFYNKDNTVYDALDGDEHGTHVSGTIAAELEGTDPSTTNTGVVGVAPNVKILPIKFLGPDGGTTADAIEAIAYAKKMGVKITNNSWGGEEYDPLLEEAIANSGSLFVAAAGNEGMDNDEGGSYPAGFESTNILSVAAVDNKGKLAPFSNYGYNSVDVAAPGVDILSSVPRYPMNEILKAIGLDQPGASAQITGENYKAIFDGIGYEKLSDIERQDAPVSQRQEAFNKALDYLGVNSSSNILLVQDDESDLAALFKDEPEISSLFKNYLPIYQNELLSGYTSLTTITVNSDSSLSNYIDKSKLAAFDAVVWFTGNGFGIFSEGGTTLTPTDTEMLKDYLANGGNLLLTGQSALGGQEKSPFVKDSLHLNVFSDIAPSLNVEGLAGGIYENTKYDVNRFESPYPFADFIKSNDPKTIVNTKYVSEYAQAYDYYSGTSMATPHTTGIAAILLGLRPSMSPEMLKLYTSAKGKTLGSLKGLVNSGKMVSSTNLDKFDDNETPGIPLEKSVLNDSLEATTDKNDVFAFSLKEGEALSLSLNGNSGTDFDLYVFDGSTETINNANGMVAFSENPNTSNESLKFTAPRTGIYFVNVYAYKGNGNYKLYTGNFGGSYEDDSNSMSFLGGWMPTFNPLHSGESDTAINSMGEVNFSFVGYNFEWKGFKDPTQGIADVYIDGIKEDTSPSLFSDTFKAKQTIFTKNFASYGKHTVRIVWTGKSDPFSRKSATGINVDNFIVKSNPASLKAYYDKGKPVISWSAVQWADSYSVYRKESSQANYELLNTTPMTTTNYSDTTAVLGKTYNYSVVINTKEQTETPLSSPVTFVYDDDIKGSQPLVGTAKGSLSADLNNKDVNDVWSKRFEQGKTYVITLAGPAGANFDLSLYNIDSKTIYDPNNPAKMKSAGKTSTEKIIFKPMKSGLYYIVPSALKGSGAYSISISILVQTAKYVENTDATIKYSGSWIKPKYTSASSGTIHQTKGYTGSLEYAFTGTGIRLYSLKDKNMGKADIYLDGVKVKQIDLYSSSRKFKAIVFDKQGLANKAHKIKIVATGKKAKAATKAFINIDAFKVTQYTWVKY